MPNKVEANKKNNMPRPQPNGQVRGNHPPQKPTGQAPKRPQPPKDSGRTANVNLTGSLNTGNFRVQNGAQSTGSFKAQNTGSFKAQNTGSFKAQNTGSFKAQSAKPAEPPKKNTSAKPIKVEKRPAAPRKSSATKGTDAYLVWFLILSIILLLALVATFIIIKFTEPAEVPSTKLPDTNNSIQAGVNPPNPDNSNNETTVPSWTVVPSNLKAFLPKTTESTKNISLSRINSAAAIVVDLKTSNVIAEANPDTIIYPASLTKIMTAIVACELITDMKDTFILTNEIINPLVAEGASRANFTTGYRITMEELVYGVILPSGADACIGLAIKLCGSEEAFVAKMNEKAAAIGCSSTRFANSTGLHDDGHYSTVRDMANILSYAMNNPFIRRVLSTKTYTTSAPLGNERDGFYYTLNCIWASRYAGNESKKATIFAAKTGYTPEAGQCLASVLETTDGGEYVVVTVGARPSYTGENTKIMPYKDAKYLADTYLG